MPKQKVSEEFILKESLKLFRQKSYHNTSMSDIAEACGLLKGSIYHYFKGKEDLMKGVINYVHAFFQNEIFKIAFEKGSPLDKLDKMFKKSEKMYLSDEGGNIMGNIGVETARVIPEFSELIQNFFMEWTSAMEHIMKELTTPEKAKIQAEQMVAEIEGAVMMTRIFRDAKFMKNTYKRIIERIKNEQLISS